jgi:hypothetical protein
MRQAMKLPVYPLFPLIAMDPALAIAWSSIIGFEVNEPIEMEVDIADPALMEELDVYLRSSHELIIKV